ncbi:site-specific integrase [Actinocatenispora comari]|uniref:Site-specific integrase n=2 Tax=Actinocatenispora comari TaxID=2807577 RepID=A0A8J4AFY3_9ACTN|nr:site-specific integrase [Actinocatenispora comari]
MEADRHRGVYVDQRAGRIRLTDYATTRWLPAQVHLRSNSTETYDRHLRNHILPALGERPIGSLGRSDMKAFVTAISGKLSASTVHTVFAVLRSLMQSAVDDQVIGVNPCSRVPLPRVTAHAVEPLPAEALLALCEAITERYRLAVVLGFGLGLREGEALGLTVPQVDFLRRRVLVREQAQNGELVELKTAASRRTVPADDWVLAEITKHMQRDGYREGPGGVLVTNRSWKIAQRSSFGHCWREAVDRAGLPAGTRFHDLRHTYASALIRANVNPKAVQTRLGHATITETMDTYGHLFPDDADLGRGAVEALLAIRPAEQRRNSGGA